MFTLSNDVTVYEVGDTLPSLTFEVVYLDLETTSGDDKLDALNVWHHCYPLLLCITGDDMPGAICVPANHPHAREWIAGILKHAKVWVNHNIKYDAHVLYNNWHIEFAGRMICTVVQAKLLNSDRFSYSLDALSKDWLDHDISGFEHEIKKYLTNSKDYARIPLDILASYGGQDVITNRRLWRYIVDMMPTDCSYLSELENDVTKILFDTENLGIRINPTHIQGHTILNIQRCFDIQREILKETGYNCRPNVNDDCYDLLCNGFGLPVVRWTEAEDASFNKDALEAYLVMPGAPTHIVNKLLEYRKLNTFRSLFLESFTRLHNDGYIHSDYNQTVRTGRMSCKRPNAQQMNKLAKQLLMPHPGHSFLSIDMSQIEFRLIVHYIDNRKAIKSYNENPDTDFHSWVAKMCGISRRPAKNVNFCMGYGGGRAKLIQMLMGEPELMQSIKLEVDKMIEAGKVTRDQAKSLFDLAALKRATDVYDTYHEALPTLRTTSKAADQRAWSRGYVFNLYGRRRYLPQGKTHIAFNALNQSTAADIMKECLRRLVRGPCAVHGVRIAAIVHDEVLFHGPTEVINQPHVIRDFIECMERTEYAKLSIPLRCSYGYSDESWYHAGLAEAKWPLEDCPWHATA